MAEGGTHHGITVTGMGRANMGRVFYAANLYYLQANDDFVKARQATIDAVRAEFPGDIQKENTVKAAWDAVGIGAFNISLDPRSISMGKDESVSLSAEVTDGAYPLVGATVTFASADVRIATVSPLSGTTGVNGRANTTVSGLSSCGSTEVTVTAIHNGKTASSKANIQVPAASVRGYLIMVIVMFTAMIVMYRKQEVNKSV
jgi:hypothetical protein